MLPIIPGPWGTPVNIPTEMRTLPWALVQGSSTYPMQYERTADILRNRETFSPSFVGQRKFAPVGLTNVWGAVRALQAAAARLRGFQDLAFSHGTPATPSRPMRVGPPPLPRASDHMHTEDWPQPLPRGEQLSPAQGRLLALGPALTGRGFGTQVEKPWNEWMAGRDGLPML